MATLPTKPKAIRPGALARDVQKFNEGVQGLSAKTKVNINGTVMTKATFQAVCQRYLAAQAAVEATKQAHVDAVNNRNAITLETSMVIKEGKTAVKSLLGRQSTQLASFGIPMDKALTTTSQQQVVANAKRRQTRQVHGIMGKRQRAAIKVVGNPPIHLPSGGEMEVGAPPVNLPQAASSPAAAPVAPAPAPAPAGGSDPTGTGNA